jgi:hypothetical protein
MVWGMDGSAVTEGLRSLRAGVDALLSGSLAGLASGEVTRLLVEVEVARRRLDAFDQVVVAEVEQRGLAGEYARARTSDLLVSLLRISPGEAKARLARTRDFGPRRSVLGEPLPPLLPVAADALRAGELSTGHATVIADCVDRIPAAIAAEAAPVAERMLVTAARHEHPRALARTAALLLARLDPDGRGPADRDLARRREFSLVKRPDGSSVPHGLLDPETTAAWEVILDSLAAPQPAADGMPDQRSPGQRRHDALAEAAHRLLRSNTLPATGGVPVTILARATLTELTTGAGTASTGHGSPLSITQLLALAGGDAEIIPVVVNQAGGVLGYGRGRRLASRGQRLALAARDGGCSFPGCDRPAAWTEVHHIIEWHHGGDTDLENMCLICRYHHREFAKRGWQVRMATDGLPEWIPPPWLDPDQQPRRNTAHHLPEIDFRTTA